MARLTLTPPPGLYTTPQTVVVSSSDPDVTGVLVTTSGDDPVFVKTVASSTKYSTPYPYSQTIEDGRGRAVFDGAFAKAYNSHWSAITPAPASANDLTSELRLLHNGLKFVLNGGTRLLVLGDKGTVSDSGTTNYFVKGTGNSDFSTALTGVAGILGATITIKDRDDYSDNLLDPTFAELSNYDAVLLISSNTTGSTPTPPSPRYITNAGVSNLAQARRSGMGIYVLTDNGGTTEGSEDRYPESFYATANYVLAGITNANFQGRFDFSPGETVLYNKTEHGDSPLFEGMADTDIVFASTSDSYVNQDVTAPSTLPVNVSVEEGYTTVKFAVLLTDGSIEFEQYGYNVGQPPIIELIDDNGDPIESWPPTILKSRVVRFEYLPGEFGNASGFVKVGDVVVGEFSNLPAGDMSGISWLDTSYTSSSNPGVITTHGDSPDVHVELTEPVVFDYVWNINRMIPGAPDLLRPAEFIQSLNQLEFASNTDPLGPLLKARDSLSGSVDPSLTLPALCLSVYDALIE